VWFILILPRAVIYLTIVEVNLNKKKKREKRKKRGKEEGKSKSKITLCLLRALTNLRAVVVPAFFFFLIARERLTGSRIILRRIEGLVAKAAFKPCTALLRKRKKRGKKEKKKETKEKKKQKKRESEKDLRSLTDRLLGCASFKRSKRNSWSRERYLCVELKRNSWFELIVEL
jgi:hypothetical protein